MIELLYLCCRVILCHKSSGKTASIHVPDQEGPLQIEGWSRRLYHIDYYSGRYYEAMWTFPLQVGHISPISNLLTK